MQAEGGGCGAHPQSGGGGQRRAQRRSAARQHVACGERGGPIPYRTSEESWKRRPMPRLLPGASRVVRRVRNMWRNALPIGEYPPACKRLPEAALETCPCVCAFCVGMCVTSASDHTEVASSVSAAADASAGPCWVMMPRAITHDYICELAPSSAATCWLTVDASGGAIIVVAAKG